jgi:hypothetical protein
MAGLCDGYKEQDLGFSQWVTVKFITYWARRLVILQIITNFKAVPPTSTFILKMEVARPSEKLLDVYLLYFVTSKNTVIFIIMNLQVLCKAENLRLKWESAPWRQLQALPVGVVSGLE